ncbi:MAG: alpha-glucosidase [Spirochaetales bacterium]|nr:alpha-glucosidase [Spirochaetales bacterium]
MSTKIVLIGAGSAMFGLGSLGNILKSPALSGSTVVLHDIDAQALGKVERVARRYIDEKKLKVELLVTTSRPEALRGAQYCIIAIEVGNRYVLWEQDWKIPLQYGIHQVYGENGGPGGLFHALRIIPPILEICGDILEICPEALVFNLSNPMTRICLAIARKFPELQVIGLCHEVVSLMEHLPQILDTPWSNLSVKAGGLNHFSVLLEALYRDSGKDAYPEIRAKAPAYFEALPEGSYENLGATKQMLEATRGSQERLPYRRGIWPERELFKVILEKFGLLPITTDSHLGEYVQWAQSSVDHKGILDFYNFYRKWCLEQVPETRIHGTLEIEYWRDIPIIEGILTDSHQEEMAVNVPNRGYIDNLPADMVVEVPATVDRHGVHPVSLGKIPKGFAGLLNNQVAVNDLTVEAALQGSRELALQALLVDPVVDNAAAAERTLDAVLEYQQEYLGYIR